MPKNPPTTEGNHDPAQDVIDANISLIQKIRKKNRKLESWARRSRWGGRCESPGLERVNFCEIFLSVSLAAAGDGARGAWSLPGVDDGCSGFRRWCLRWGIMMGYGVKFTTGVVEFGRWGPSVTYEWQLKRGWFRLLLWIGFSTNFLVWHPEQFHVTQ